MENEEAAAAATAAVIRFLVVPMMRHSTSGNTICCLMFVSHDGSDYSESLVHILEQKVDDNSTWRDWQTRGKKFACFKQAFR